MLRRNRLAQGLPITTVILAVLGIIVLIIIGVMVSQRSSWFGKTSREVAEQTCSPPNDIEPIGTDCEVIYSSFKDVKPGSICCKNGTKRT